MMVYERDIRDMEVVTGGAIPQAKDVPNECVFEHKKICSSPNEIGLMREFVGLGDMEVKGDADVIEKTKSKLSVDKESAIWSHPAFKKFVGEHRANRVLSKIFKPIGPTDTTELLNNKMIDETLGQWAEHSTELFGKKFRHVPFQMIDFMERNTELAKFTILDTLKSGFNCFGVVLNTDVSSGKGKHWFCVYGILVMRGVNRSAHSGIF